MTDAYQPDEAKRRTGSPADSVPPAPNEPIGSQPLQDMAGDSGGQGAWAAPTGSDPIGGPSGVISGTGSTGSATSDWTSVTDAPTSVGANSTGSTGSGSSGVKDAAKEEASNLKGTAKEEAANLKGSAADAGRRVAGTAKQDAKHVAGEAKHQARQLLDQTLGEVKGQASGQQRRLAEGVGTFGSQLRDMADGKGADSGLASQLVREISDRADGVSSWLQDREPADLLEDVKSFARRRPGAFIAIAGVAGLLVGRLARGMVSEARESSGESSTTGPTYGATGTTGSTYGSTGYGTGYSTGSTYGAGASELDGGAARGFVVDGDVPAQTGHSPQGTGRSRGAHAADDAPGAFEDGIVPPAIGHTDEPRGSGL